MDGCAGIDGWYVDDVKVQACNTKKALRRRSRKALRYGEGAGWPGALPQSSPARMSPLS